MAIILCHECRKDLSDAALVCPTCGAKTRFASRQDQTKADRNFVIFLVIGLGIALFIGRILYIQKQNQEFIDSGRAEKVQRAIRGIEESTERIRRAQEGK